MHTTWSIVSKADDRSKRMNIDFWRAFAQATCGRSGLVIRQRRSNAGLGVILVLRRRLGLGDENSTKTVQTIYFLLFFFVI